MRIAILTSSRADYGIYLPLIRKLKAETSFQLCLIVFGTHLSPNHGNTDRLIEADGFDIDFRIDTVPKDDSVSAISESIGETIKKFSAFWSEKRDNFDLVFCLGDRYEMFAAVFAGVPSQIPFAHIHGGEISLGAIDNVFRHAMTHASQYHFTSTRRSAERVCRLIESEKNVFHVGSLSLDNLSDLYLLSKEEFYSKWKIDLSKKTILATVHPETKNLSETRNSVAQFIDGLKLLKEYQFLITMPNADPNGDLIRKGFDAEFALSKNVFLIENLGTLSYFSALRHCAFLLGNTSSGIIEAASFNKFVINLGDRQKMRECGPNIVNAKFLKEDILKAVKYIEETPYTFSGNIYRNGNAADNILKVLKQMNK